MVVAIRDDERQRGEATQDLLTGPRTAESLEQLLKHEPGGHDLLSALERSCESRDFGSVRGPVAAEGKRPDARVDEQRQPRERSAL